MTNDKIIGAVIAVLMLLFNIGDLIGTQNQARLEEAWLATSTKLLRSWQTSARNSARWWLALLVSALGFLIAGSIIAGFFYSTRLVRDNWAVGGSSLWRAIGLLAVTALLLPLGLRFLGTILDSFLSSPSDKRDPVEVRWVRWFLKRPLQMPQGGGDSPAAPFIAGCLPVLFVLVGFLLAPLASVVVVGRIVAYGGLLLVWLPILGPARLLHAIGRRTGAESYLKAGKYLLSVLSTLLALYLIFR